MATQVSNQLERANGAVKENLKDMPQAAKHAVSEARDLSTEGLEFLKSNIADVREMAQDALKTSEKAIRNNPFYAIAGAAAIGVVAGFLLTRSRK